MIFTEDVGAISVAERATAHAVGETVPSTVGFKACREGMTRCCYKSACFNSLFADVNEMVWIRGSA